MSVRNEINRFRAPRRHVRFFPWASAVRFSRNFPQGIALDLSTLDNTTVKKFIANFANKYCIQVDIIFKDYIIRRYIIKICCDRYVRHQLCYRL